MFERIEKLIGGLASLMLFFLMLITLVDVLGRNLMNSPLYGSTELTELCLAALAFLLFPKLAYHQGHIAIDLLDAMTGRTTRMLQQLASALIGVGINCILVWRFWILANRSMNYGDVTASLNFPIGLAYYFMSVLSVVGVFAFLASIPGIIRDPDRLIKTAQIAGD